MITNAEQRFMQQQGFPVEGPAVLIAHFRALRFQPLVVASLVLLAIILQSRVLFFLLAAVLAWSVALPQWNPFERLFDWLIGRARGLAPLGPAPGPRRFAQGMASAFMLCAGLALSLHRQVPAYVFEGFLVVALVALLAGKFCLGSYIYHVLHGRVRFANATCPWSHGG